MVIVFCIYVWHVAVQPALTPDSKDAIYKLAVRAMLGTDICKAAYIPFYLWDLLHLHGVALSSQSTIQPHFIQTQTGQNYLVTQACHESIWLWVYICVSPGISVESVTAWVTSTVTNYFGTVRRYLSINHDELSFVQACVL